MKCCRTCNRHLRNDQFVQKSGNPTNTCRQCHAGQCAARRNEVLTIPPDPLNTTFSAWRGPVRHEPLRWCA